MVIDANEIEDIKDNPAKRRLQDQEHLIDAELRANAERLNNGREVMIPCVMPFEYYSGLVAAYSEVGWKVRHEKINAYGRLYFSKDPV